MSEPGAFTGYLEEWDEHEPEQEPLCIYCLTEQCRLHGGTYWPGPDIFGSGAMFR